MNSKDQRAQHSRLEEIFDRAVGITSPSERQTYVLEACAGDAKLLQRLRVLLREHDCNDELFDAPESVCFSVTPEVPEYKRFGEFEIVREIGRGGMGVVYEAQQTSLKRRVALKILPVGSRLSKSSLVRFRREAEAAAKLHHTNIVPVYTTGIQDGTPYYAMELIEGPSLDHILDQLRDDSEPTTTGNASPDEQRSTVGAAAVETQRFTSSLGAGREYYDNVATVVADIAEALDHAHHHRIIHRDIKPSNLLITPEGKVIVTDFGLARVEEPGLTATGEMIGSPRYMSPEQISPDRGTLDHRTDIYSLGVTLYELITLRTAFSGENKATTLHEVVHREPKPPRQIDSKIPIDLDTICRKAMEKEPDRRYQSARAMADDLRRFINRYQISARRIGPVDRAVRWCRRNRTVATLSLLLLALLVLGSTLFGWQLRKQKLAQIAEWNRTLSSISLLREQGKEFDATRRLHAALQRFPARSEELERVFGEMGRKLSIMTERFGTGFRGAEIFARSIESPTSDWLPLGTTPLSVRLPDGTYHIKCATDDASIITLQFCSRETVDWKITLPIADGTVCVPVAWQKSGQGRINWLKRRPMPELAEFQIDRYEVTNAEYQQFVDSGGYETEGKKGERAERYWYSTLGSQWRKTVATFRDETGNLGPCFWRNGRLPSGDEDLPVVGVSWYEAHAYATWAGKKLPTVFHWLRASNFNGWYDHIELTNISNIGNRRARPIATRNQESVLTANEYGAFDLAGNVKEWCLNEEHAGHFYALGGGFSDTLGGMYEPVAISALERRRPDVGFRCAIYTEELNEPLPIHQRAIQKAQAPIDSYAEHFAYDRDKPFNATRRRSYLNGFPAERVDIDAVADDSRMSCYVLLPDDSRFRTPYQVVLIPEKLSVQDDGTATVPNKRWAQYRTLLGNGRALVFPALWGMSSSRHHDDFSSHPRPGEDEAFIRSVANPSMGISRTADLIQASQSVFGQEILDKNELAFCSRWCKQACWLAADSKFAHGKNRFRAAIFSQGGLSNCDMPEEVDQYNYVRYVDVPVLLINLERCLYTPMSSSVLPMMELLSGETELFKVPNQAWMVMPDDFDRAANRWLDKHLGEPERG